MLLGNKYADNKLYRGIKHYDHLPLTSEDLHEYADTLHMKNAIIMDSLLGSGVLNEPRITLSSNGLEINSPLRLLVDGDVILVQSDNGLPILPIQEIEDAGYKEGLLCVVGWYQFLNHDSTLRSYGGVKNDVLENDLFHAELNMQVSTRYQFRWDTVIVNKEGISSDSPFTFSLINRDKDGNITSGSTEISSTSLLGDVRIAPKPSTMDYAISDLYIIPVLSYKYENSAVTSSETFKARKSGVTSSSIYLRQYSNTVTIDSSMSVLSNIDLSIGISEYVHGDLLQVIYEGLLLTEGKHYALNSNGTITLLDTKVESGDIVTFIAIKIEDRR